MRVAVVLGIFILSSFAAYSQQSYTAYLDIAFRETAKRKAVYVRKMVEQADNSLTAEVRDIETNALKMKGTFVEKGGALIEEGEFTFFYPSGKVESKGSYQEGMKVGAWQRFTQSGAQRPDRYYDPSRTEILKSVVSK